MLKFFLPASKVQKDRRIMRETDSRMAKYSRRGLISNFFVFLICLAHGRFIDDNPQLMGVLTVGLLLITLLRGLFLFRFDQLYPRAPAKWRNRYFVATLIGACWWGVILVSVTTQLEMEEEAPLLWLYTVIFFSTTAHAFAPYQKFLSYYQFFGLVPAAASAIYLGDFEGYLYGILMLFFFLVLSHQCRLISENYWEKLEATYALARKTLSMEEEKRDTKANVKLNQEFMQRLHSDIDRFMSTLSDAENLSEKHLKSIIRNELHSLHTNISDFNGVLSKSLELEENIFNIRHEIQHLVTEFIDDAESRNIQIETSLSPTLPMRLKGDASRLAQIIRSLLNIILHDIDKCIVLVEVEFLREYDTAGELYVSVTRSFDKSKKLFASDSMPKVPQGTLSLVVAKGLADLMDGSIEFNDAMQNEQQFRFNAKIDIADRTGQLDFHKDSFSGRNVLLVHNHPRIVDLKRQELDALGFNVFTETQYKRAIQTLQDSYKFQNPIESLVFYLEPDNQSVITFCQNLLDIAELKYTRKIGAATRRQQSVMRKNGFDEANGFYYVDKPTGLFEIESMFHQIYKQENEDGEHTPAPEVRVGFVTEDFSGDSILRQHIQQMGDEITSVEHNDRMIGLINDGDFDIIVIDCDTLSDINLVVRNIRSYEAGKNMENFMPILGVSSSREELEDTAYELGLDDYLDLTHNPKKTLKRTISYWSTLLLEKA
ncbi:ATP-binding response regulator [Agarilytica rhodophyticola]|uniref:ATP-binding response regulator n=1 Tax=Agarilytica rhodophyticola TaxID=1737490 RepID=UPI000B341B3F|nr:hybrid sensor histidine kinase/response regulator [Agarilytica rhodophyticola]